MGAGSTELQQRVGRAPSTAISGVLSRTPGECLICRIVWSKSPRTSGRRRQNHFLGYPCCFLHHFLWIWGLFKSAPFRTFFFFFFFSLLVDGGQLEDAPVVGLLAHFWEVTRD